MIYKIVARCELKKKNIALFVFNDLFIHLSESKAGNLVNLSLKKYQWPLELVWISERSTDFVKFTGPDNKYKFRTTDVLEMLNPVRRAITDRLKELDPPEALDVTSPYRFGSYEFLAKQSTFSGKWKNGRPFDGSYCHMGTLYKGELAANGDKHGMGTQTSLFKDTYTGIWLNNRPRMSIIMIVIIH